MMNFLIDKIRSPSLNIFLKVPDMSINTINALNGNVITFTEDVSMNGGLMISDICVNNIKALNGGKIIINSDLSINNKLTGTEASFNMILLNIATGILERNSKPEIRAAAINMWITIRERSRNHIASAAERYLEEHEDKDAFLAELYSWEPKALLMP